jgi:folate-binding protein YgfZ
VIADSIDLAHDYQYAQQHALQSSVSTGGKIWASGLHRLDLPHRLSTNDLNSLAVGQARPTVLTTAIGRIIDLLWVLNCGERVLLLTSPQQAEPVRRWLGRNVFFNDQVQFSLANELQHIQLVGGAASQILASALPELPALAVGQLQALGAGWVVRLPDWGPLAVYRLLAPADTLTAWRAALQTAHALPSTDMLFDLLRIEAGQPAAGHEISNEFIPLEVGLTTAVSFSKGCYIGQEIIARLDSRGRLAKKLVGLRSTEPLSSGQRLSAATGEHGLVTSSAFSPRLGYIGLGVLKPSAAIAGTALTVQPTTPVEPETGVANHTAVVCLLPFEAV